MMLAMMLAQATQPITVVIPQMPTLPAPPAAVEGWGTFIAQISGLILSVTGLLAAYAALQRAGKAQTTASTADAKATTATDVSTNNTQAINTLSLATPAPASVPTLAAAVTAARPGMRSCPTCGGVIALAARSCPLCGQPFAAPAPRVPAIDPTAAPPAAAPRVQT
jgi:hypothetical protein